MKSHRRSSGANEAMFKLIMIGDSGTGKSCLLVRYIKDQFNQEYNVTVGVQFASKTLKIDENYRVKLQIWDTAGQESFRSIVKSFYRNSAAVILVYNITKRKTFDSLSSWIAQAKENSPKNAIFVLIGTHLDMQDERQVTKQEAEKWMKQQEITMFFQTSAKTSQNVAKAFEEVAKQLFYTQLNKRRGSTMNVNMNQMNEMELTLSDKKKEESGKCC